jgi:hypothetical protein
LVSPIWIDRVFVAGVWICAVLMLKCSIVSPEEEWKTGVHPYLKSFSSLHGHLNLNEGTKLSNTNGQFKQIRNNKKLIKSKM